MPIVDLLNSCLNMFTETEKELVSVERVQRRHTAHYSTVQYCQYTTVLYGAGPSARPCVMHAAQTWMPVFAVAQSLDTCVLQYLDAPPESSEGGWEPPRVAATRGSIEFARVRMSYGVGAPLLVLNDLSFSIRECPGKPSSPTSPVLR